MDIFLFSFGLAIGSFLNVLIDRLPKDESPFFGRSYCDHCHHKLSWYDLIPLLSYMLLRGKCRYCRKKISRQYPVIELITGILYVFTYKSVFGSFEFGSNYFALVYFLTVVSGLIVIFFADLKYRIIPDQIVLVLMVAALVFTSISQFNNLFNNLISGLSLFLIFLALVILTKGKGMGLGDVKFALVMGFILGFPKILVAFYLSFLTGAFISLILILVRKKTMKSTIPFGPFLVVATFFSLFYGLPLWDFFKKMLGI